MRADGAVVRYGEHEPSNAPPRALGRCPPSDLQAELDRARAQIEELQAERDRLARLVEQLERQAMTDPLTGLRNRRSLWEQLSLQVDRAEATSQSFSVLFVDIDHFKRINDTWGHITGDMVLRQVAQLLRADLRVGDVVVPVGTDDVTLARFGGEEFVVVLPETSLDGGVVVAERLRGVISSIAFHSADRRPLPPVTVSAGVASYDFDLDCFDFEGVLDRADQALYAAKAAGRDCVRALTSDQSLANCVA
jgi:diguanylate cyclase (GGDEF)-like protein